MESSFRFEKNYLKKKIHLLKKQSRILCYGYRQRSVIGAPSSIPGWGLHFIYH